MSAKKTGLGRSFASLIPTELLDESFDPTAEQDEHVSDLRHIKLADIVADPDQPRRQFDDVSLDELAVSIREHGILQPIVVTPHQGKFMIVAGERRYRATERAGLDKIPALVRTLSNQHKLEVSLIENLQRRDLNPLETATAYLKLRDQFNLTLDEIGDRVGGRSSATISNTLRLLRLPQAAREALAAGQLREGQIRPLINLDADVIEAILPRIIKEGWSARMAEEYAARVKAAPTIEEKKAVKVVPSRYDQHAMKLAKRLDTRVQVKQLSNGAGKIIISCKTMEEFERIARLIEKEQ